MELFKHIMIIGEVVKRVAKDRGFGAAALAEAMDMSRRAVYDWFNSDNIGSKTLSQLSKLLEYDFGVHIHQQESNSAGLLHEPVLGYGVKVSPKKAPIRISIEIDPDFSDANDLPAFIKKLNEAVKEFEKKDA